MMTSVTLPTNSASLLGGYSSVSDEPTDSDFEPSRPSKRCLPSSLAESCKKRRKQSTPVRISAAESDQTEGKLPIPPNNQDPDLRCLICGLICDNSEQLESHVRLEHSVIECKKEIEEPQSVERPNTPIEVTPRPDQLPWINDLPNKEWIGPGILPFSANHMFMSLPQFPQPETVPPRQPIRIFNPDAYCELCNKEFCNKYFLKTHKANKHGIYSDPPSSDNIPTSVNVPSYGGNIKLPGIVPIDVKSEPKPVNALNPFSDLFSNPFTNKLLPKVIKNIPKDSDTEHNGIAQDNERNTTEEQPRDESSSSPRMPPENIKTEIDQDNMYYIPTSKMSPGQQNRELDLSNRLRRIGVMNPKAFCEICCKEYCNKYFLRTHKMKRHGIYIPDEGKERGDNKLEIFGNMLWPQNTQTSPLNLIMAEQSNSNSNADRKTSSSPADVSCEICEIKFQNVSLLQLHNVSVHAKLGPNQETSNGGSEEEKQDDNKPNDTISEDLQKLQTMILQLNDLDVNNKANCTCTMCNKEFENRYFLHAHMMTEHGLLLDDMQENEKSLEGAETNINNNTMCDLCGKDFQNVQDMKKHILEFHSNNQQTVEPKEEFNGFTTPEKSVPRPPANNQVPERRASMNMTPTSSYCEICNKELCNKYFMKTHMQRMHGIEIENGAQIGGVICDICNKELCSKYFLRVHKHNTHGIVEYGTSLLQPRKTEDTTNHPPPEENSLKSTDLADLSHRYFTHFTEVCTICSRRFRSTKWLKAHLLSDHGQAGVDKWAELESQLQHTMNQQKTVPVRTSPPSDSISPTIKIPNNIQEGQSQVGIQNVLSSIFGDDDSNVKTYHCSYCPFTTPILPFLFVHERSHSMPSSVETEFKCPVCGQMFHQTELLQHHIFSQHPFLPLPPFFNTNGEDVKEQQTESAEEVDDELKKGKKIRRKVMTTKETTISEVVGPSLKDIAKRSQLPATYALPQKEESSQPPYIMQPFLLEESNQERRIVPSMVFLPVLQKQSAPITVTFTLTPA